MRRKHPARPAQPPSAPEDRSWAARAEALKRENPAQIAVLAAVFASLSMLAGWIAIIVPPVGNMRFNPLFWLVVAPLMPWLWSVLSFSAWAMRTVWVALMLAPCLSLLALFVAPIQRKAALLGDGVPHLDTPLAMLIILGVTTVLSGAGLVALRRSSLPGGGTRAVTYVAPGTPMPGVPRLTPAATNTLTKGSLPFSGALINGFFFGIVATMEPVGPGGDVWPLGLVAILVLSVGILVFRGSFRLARRRPGAARDLRRGWWLGMGCATAAVLALWAWPTLTSAKLAFSCFMVPVAIAAAWCGTSALRALPGVVKDMMQPPPAMGPYRTAKGASATAAHAKGLLPVALLLIGLGPAFAAEVPADVTRQLPPGFVVLGSAAASFGQHAFTIVALGKQGEDKRPWPVNSAAARPLLLFERRLDGSFRQAGRNDHVVMRADGGGQCDPFLDGGGTIAVKDRFFTVENGVACGPQHWTDDVTFRFNDSHGRYVFDNERSESWSLNSSNDPNAEAIIRDGPPRVIRGDRARPVPFDRWRPSQ